MFVRVTMPIRRSFGFSAENPEGKRNGGSRGADCEKIRPCIQIEPGKTVVLADVDGPGALTHFWMTGYTGHSFILRIYWDNEGIPAVKAPLSAFFGMAYDENWEDRDGRYPCYQSAALSVVPGRGCNSFFFMPFLQHCRITVENRGVKEEPLYYMIEGYQGVLDTEYLIHSSTSFMTLRDRDVRYFHAEYRQAHPVQKGKAYTALDIAGTEGCFAGITLAIGINGNNTCFVEGEPKMYIDGDRYPTINYTGTEDYFGGAYGFGNDISQHRYQTFSGPYQGLYAILGDNNAFYNQQQRFLFYRFHIADPVFFSESFRFTFDNLGWTGPRYDDYTSVCYWYQKEPAGSESQLPTDQELIMK
jgi:hypothetical protein